jgi:enolase
MDKGEQVDFIVKIAEKYSLVYIEDPVHEDDYEGFVELTKKLKDCLICGDDLFVTNHERLIKGIEMGAANSIIVKVNQIGTLTDAQNAVELAEKNHYIPVISHRSGETTDAYLAHLAVGFKCPIIKTGILGGERISKINELIRIEEMMGETAKMSMLSI